MNSSSSPPPFIPSPFKETREFFYRHFTWGLNPSPPCETKKKKDKKKDKKPSSFIECNAPIKGIRPSSILVNQEKQYQERQQEEVQKNSVFIPPSLPTYHDLLEQKLKEKEKGSFSTNNNLPRNIMKPPSYSSTRRFGGPQQFGRNKNSRIFY